MDTFLQQLINGLTLVEAMKKANSADPAKYLPVLAKISYDGITAKIEFDEHGDTKNGAITLYQVKDGKLMPMAVNVGGKTDKVAAAGETMGEKTKEVMKEAGDKMKEGADKMKAALPEQKAMTPANKDAMKAKGGG